MPALNSHRDAHLNVNKAYRPNKILRRSFTSGHAPRCDDESLDRMPNSSTIDRTQPRTVIMFAVMEGHGITNEDMRLGTPGILLSSEDPEVLMAAIREMGRGRMPESNEVARRVVLHVTEPRPVEVLAERVTELSPREKEVLNALVEGLSYKMIAARLSISFETVRSHIKRIYEKLRVHNNTEAVAKALKFGLVA